MIEDILTETERDLIVNFNDNAPLKEAIKKAMTMFLYEQGVIKKGKKHDLRENWALAMTFNQGDFTNEELGAKLRAKAEALRFLDNAFVELDTIKKVGEITEKINKAR